MPATTTSTTPDPQTTSNRQPPPPAATLSSPPSDSVLPLSPSALPLPKPWPVGQPSRYGPFASQIHQQTRLEFRAHDGQPDAVHLLLSSPNRQQRLRLARAIAHTAHNLREDEGLSNDVVNLIHEANRLIARRPVPPRRRKMDLLRVENFLTQAGIGASISLEHFPADELPDPKLRLRLDFIGHNNDDPYPNVLHFAYDLLCQPQNLIPATDPESTTPLNTPRPGSAGVPPASSSSAAAPAAAESSLPAILLPTPGRLATLTTILLLLACLLWPPSAPAHTPQPHPNIHCWGNAALRLESKQPTDASEIHGVAAQPNLVIIMADQLRRDAIGAFTPRIQALMRESVCFDRAYCASPLCVPARGAFYAGRYPNETGCIVNPWIPQEYRHGLVPAGTPNLYELLETEFHSVTCGKQHFFMAAPGQPGQPAQLHNRENSPTEFRILEKFYGPFLKERGLPAPGGPAYRGKLPEIALGKYSRMKQYSIPTTGLYEPGFDAFYDGWIANQCVDIIRAHAGNSRENRPLLLNATFVAPHPPLHIPDPYYSLVPRDIELPANVGQWSKDQSPLSLYNLNGYFGARYTREDWQKIWPVYLGLVKLLDDGVGLIVDALKEQGLYDNSLILFTADHGELLGSHCGWQKTSSYEESAHVPLTFKLPAGRNGGGKWVKHSDALVSHVDVLPTLLDLLGRERPSGLSGVSLRGALQGEPLTRDRIFIQTDGNGARGNYSRCVVAGDLKLNVDLFKDEIFFELYDLKTDPQEQTNLAFERPAAVRDLLPSLIDWMQATGDLLTLTPADYDGFLNGYGLLRS